MAPTGKLRGHPMYWTGEEWRYVDTDEPTAGSPRPCGHCGREDTAEGHDACLGELPGVRNACCGHGEEREAYVQLAAGPTLRGQDALDWIQRTTGGHP